MWYQDKAKIWFLLNIVDGGVIFKIFLEATYQ